MRIRGFSRRIKARLCVRAHLSPLRQQFRDTDEVIADQIEQKVGSHSGQPPVFHLAHGAVLLASSEQTLDHVALVLREGVALCRVVCPSMAVLRAFPVFVTYVLTAMCGVMFFARRPLTRASTS